MTFEQFQAVVEEMVGEIPDEFMRGLPQGVQFQAVVEEMVGEIPDEFMLEDAYPEEDYDDVWRLGEYLDPGPEDFLGAGEGLGRHVALYYGSFQLVAEGDPEFDWEEEIWETLTHELRHHVESLAGDMGLILEDERLTDDFKRRE